jgi:hypothetical protein
MLVAAFPGATSFLAFRVASIRYLFLQFSSVMNIEILSYNQHLSDGEAAICHLLAEEIDTELKEAVCKIWHAHPVWFLEDNPVVGYSKQKQGIRLMFWSGADFEEQKLHVLGGKFKDASIFYHHIAEVNKDDLNRWLKKSRDIQWDYKNIVKRKGKLERLKQ